MRGSACEICERLSYGAPGLQWLGSAPFPLFWRLLGYDTDGDDAIIDHASYIQHQIANR